MKSTKYCRYQHITNTLLNKGTFLCINNMSLTWKYICTLQRICLITHHLSFLSSFSLFTLKKDHKQNHNRFNCVWTRVLLSYISWYIQIYRYIYIIWLPTDCPGNPSRPDIPGGPRGPSDPLFPCVPGRPGLPWKSKWTWLILRTWMVQKHIQ